MTLQSIDIPVEVKQLEHSTAAVRLIDMANERIEAFLLADDSVTENFIPCDFHLFDQTLRWIDENQLMRGPRFCELGSGFGVTSLLASLRGMNSVGVEVEPKLVEQANKLTDELGLKARFFCGSFVPRSLSEMIEPSPRMQRFTTHVEDLLESMKVGLDAFDLFFAFPWPGQQSFYEAVFDSVAKQSALLLSYHGSNGMRLARKV